MLTIIAILLKATANVLTVAFAALCLLLMLRFVLNFYAEGTSNPGVVFVFRFTELILDPVRRKMGVEPRTVDLSMVIVFFGTIFFGTIIVEILNKLAAFFGS